MSELVDSELVIEVGKPAHGGYCLAHIDQGTVFVRFALPGEKVRIRITNRSKRVLFADAIEILEPSPDRVPSVWPAASPRIPKGSTHLETLGAARLFNSLGWRAGGRATQPGGFAPGAGFGLRRR